jgi:hypothetical protein
MWITIFRLSALPMPSRTQPTRFSLRKAGVNSGPSVAAYASTLAQTASTRARSSGSSGVPSESAHARKSCCDSTGNARRRVATAGSGGR